MALTVPFLIAGCQQAPSFNVVGSIFPDWILCSIVGLVVGPLVHATLVHFDLDKEIDLPVLIYPCIVISCALTTWLVFFS